MSVLKARLVNRHGYYLEVQNNGTISSNVKGDSLNGKEVERLPFGFVFQSVVFHAEILLNSVYIL